VVLLGDVRPADRIAVPVNMAGWELGGSLSPAVVVHAQSVRTALSEAPVEAARPLSVLLVTVAALIVLMKDWRMALATALLAAITLFVAATLGLRAGFHTGIAAPLLTALVAAVTCRWTIRKPLK
jgi:uncharacterized membrane protein